MVGAPYSPESLFGHRIVALAVSWMCDSTCRHCFIPREVRGRDQFDPAVYQAVLRHLPGSVRLVSFTGGEPFLYPGRFLKLLRAVLETGRSSSVVTNAAWALDWPKARSLLRSAYRCGLRGLAVSLDDYHRPRMPVEVLVKLLGFARELGMAVHVKGVGKRSRSMVARISDSGVLDGQERADAQYDLERVGHGARLGRDRVGPVELNHCLGAMEPLVTPTGDVFACCTPRILDMDDSLLRLGNVQQQALDRILDRTSRSFPLGAVVALGAGGILQLLGRRVPKRVDSRCGLCISLLSDPLIVEELGERLSADREARKEIAGRLLVYETCYKPDLMPEVYEI